MKNTLLTIGITIILLIVGLSGCNQKTEINNINDNNGEGNFDKEIPKPDIIDLKLVELEKQGYYPQLYAVGLVKNIAKVNINNVTVIIKLLNETKNVIYSEIKKLHPDIIEPNEYGVFLFRKSVEYHESVIVEINSFFYTNETNYKDLILENNYIIEKSNQSFSIGGFIKNRGNNNVSNITIFIIAFDIEDKLLDLGGSSIIGELNVGQQKYYEASITIFDKWYDVDDIKSTEFKISYNVQK